MLANKKILDNTLFIMGIMGRIKKKPLKQEVSGERISSFTSAKCLGSDCYYFAGEECNSKQKLVDASGDWDSPDSTPLARETDWAAYLQLCKNTGSELMETYVGIEVVSPNDKSTQEQLDVQRARIADTLPTTLRNDG